MPEWKDVPPYPSPVDSQITYVRNFFDVTFLSHISASNTHVLVAEVSSQSSRRHHDERNRWEEIKQSLHFSDNQGSIRPE
ncbi:hypothetical protein MRX96_002958 [Rhipicephalus microplus]